MKHITKFLLFLLLPAALTFQACDKEIADTTAATDEKNVAADASQSMVSIVAGCNQAGYNDGPALQAQFQYLEDVAVSKDGSIYIAEWAHIRKLKDGQVTTVAGTGAVFCKDGPVNTVDFAQLKQVAVADDGTLYVVEYAYGSQNCVGIRKISTDGIVSSVLERSGILHLGVGPEGNIYFIVNSTIGRELFKITPDGIITSISEGGYSPQFAVAPDGNIYLNEAKNISDVEKKQTLIKITPEGSVINTEYQFNTSFFFEGLAVADDGSIYTYASTYNSRQMILKLNKNNTYDIIAGAANGPEVGPALKVKFNKDIDGIIVHNNALYITNKNEIKKITLP